MINIEENIGLARKFAYKNAKRVEGRMEFDELLSNSYLSLIKAANNYNEKLGFKFSTLAYKTMELDLKRHLINNRWNTFRTRDKEGKDVCKRVEIISTSARIKNSGKEGDKPLTIEDLIKSTNKIEEGYAERMHLKNCIEKLDDKDREIVYLYFYKDLTQSQIANLLGIKQSSISRRVKRAIKNLREVY